jgi:uncharacterized protein YdaU (DUF1376 family)
MSKPPKADVWMPLYIDDWDSKTRHLDCEQDGAYGRLVRHYWKNGPPADDDGQLARIVGMERVKWRKVRPVLSTFFAVRDGRWFHERVDEELERAREIIEKRRQAGLQGGRPRKQMVSETESKTKANGNQKGKQNETPAGVEVEVSELTQEPTHKVGYGIISEAEVISLAGRAAR